MNSRNDHASERAGSSMDASRMDADRTVVKELFCLMLEAEAAHGMPEGEAVVTEARAAMQKADAAVRRTVEQLLLAHGRAAGLLLDQEPDGIAPSADGGARVTDATMIVPQIGDYEIGEEIGRGGFGVVYRAKQLRPVERSVAVKILRTELATEEVIARFRGESRVLARMSHAGIARVLDAGLDAQGRPFVTMELVRGEPLVAYCQGHTLNVRERVRLMIEVCEAVHHAHQRAVVHRDLKPANILVERVDDRHQPRVIDFGIAKILEENADHTQTQLGARLGTPRYMSPEQYAGTDSADVRTDVYALGAVLCEALTNQVPRDPTALDDASGSRSKTRATRPSRLAALSSGEIALRSSELRGDLDRIVLKAVALDPEDRYDSAAALAEDLQRYLDGMPVKATSPSIMYLTRKFIARRKLTSAAIALALLSMICGTSAAMYGMNRANESKREAIAQQQRAAREAAVASEINEFWIDIIRRGSPSEARRPDLQVREALDLAAPHLTDQIRDPKVRGRLHETFADAYHTLGIREAQLHHARRAWSLWEQSGATDEPAEALRAHLTLGTALLEAYELDEARPILRAARALCETHPAILAERLPSVLTVLSRLADREGDYAAAEQFLLEAAKVAPEQLGPNHPMTLVIEKQLALMIIKLGRNQEAIDILEPLLARQRAALGADHLDTIGTLTTLANALQNLGRFDEAERVYHELLEMATPILGEDHYFVVLIRNNYAALLRSMRRFDEAEVLFRAVLDSRSRQDGAEHPITLQAASNLAMTLVNLQRFDEAEPLLEETSVARARVLGSDHPDTIHVQQVLASMYHQTGRSEEAAARFEALLEQLRHAVPPGHVRLSPLLRNYGLALRELGRLDEALPLLIESHEIFLAYAGPDHPQTHAGFQLICDVLVQVGPTAHLASWRERCAALDAATDAVP